MARQKTVERYMPIVYFLGAMVLLVGLLPSALRPPPDQANSAAEFSPDAPPDENQDSIVAALNRGSTGTAGSGNGVGEGEAADSGAPPEVLDAQAPAKACPLGFGDPPRQIESIYAAPCAKPFEGDNGGATHKGVSATEVRIAVQGTVGNQPGNDGPILDTPPAGENAQRRTLRVLQSYVNQAFQLYGRRIQLYVVKAGEGAATDSSEVKSRNAAAKADQEYKVFAGTFYDVAFCDEMARRDLVSFCPQLAADYFQEKSPHLYSWYMDGTKMAEMTAEYACKKLVGKPPKFNSEADPTFNYGAPRKFGMIYYDNPNGTPNAVHFRKSFAEQCGGQLAAEIGYNVDDADGQNRLSQAAVRMKAEGVTTVVLFNDFTTNIAVSNSADRAGYYPEWLTNGFGAIDRNQLARLQNANQWRHAFGFTGLDMERPNEATDCWKAYKVIDPANTPNAAICTYVWPSLLQIVGGVQLAGPKLTPTAFRDGLFKQGYRWYDDLDYAIGGGFGPGDLTYTDNVAEIWWDPTATDPTDGRSPGAYRYVRNGKRYKQGEFPQEDPLVFQEGVTETEDSY